MNLAMEEEKKEAVGWGEDISVGSCSRCNRMEDTSDNEDKIEEFGDLPLSITGRIGMSFESEEALEAALVEAGVGDLPVILLDGKPRLVMLSDQHNKLHKQLQLELCYLGKKPMGLLLSDKQNSPTKWQVL